jgi:hypothetical protein
MKIEEIQSRLTSEDPEVLEQARAFITEMLAAETARGSVAEGRAATTLGVIAVVAGFAVTAAGSIVSGSGPTSWHLLIGYAGALAFLVRGAYFCLRTVSPQKYFIITPDLIFDLQAGSRLDSLRSEIAYKMWQYERDVVPNSGKVFWLGRGQRGLLVGVALLSLTALLARVHVEHPLSFPVWARWTLALLLAALFFLLDPIVERAGDWRKGRHYKVKA